MFNRFSVERSSSKISILLNGCGLQNYKKQHMKHKKTKITLKMQSAILKNTINIYYDLKILRAANPNTISPTNEPIGIPTRYPKLTLKSVLSSWYTSNIDSEMSIVRTAGEAAAQPANKQKRLHINFKPCFL